MIETKASNKRRFGAFLRLKRAVVGLMAAAMVSSPVVLPATVYAYTETDILNMQGHGTISPSYLVVHSTANPGATAANHVAYWTRMGNGSTMAHWVIDWTNNGNVYQMAYSDRLVYHVGYGNRYSVGIEICEATNQADFDTVFDEAAKWCADFLRTKGWGIDRMVSHNEARTIWGGTDHTDPLPYFARFGKTWGDFETLVSKYMADGQWHDSEGGDAPAVEQPVQPSQPGQDSDLGDLSWWGPKYTAERQRQLGTEVDGAVSRQPGSNSRYLMNADRASWQIGGAIRTSGGYTGSWMVKELQTRLKRLGYYGDAVDGWFGYNTSMALQRWLTDRGYSVGGYGCNGYMGPDTCGAIGRALQDGAFSKM